MCALLNRIGWHRQNTFRGSSGVDKMNSHGVPWEIALNLAFSIVSLFFFYFCFPIFNFLTVACQANPCMSPTILILYLTDCASPSSSSASLSKVSSSWGTNSASSSSSSSTLGSSGPCCYCTPFSAVFFTAGISCSWSPAASGFSFLSNTFCGKISNGCMGLGSKAFMQLMMTSIVCIFCHHDLCILLLYLNSEASTSLLYSCLGIVHLYTATISHIFHTIVYFCINPKCKAWLFLGIHTSTSEQYLGTFVHMAVAVLWWIILIITKLLY